MCGGSWLCPPAICCEDASPPPRLPAQGSPFLWETDFLLSGDERTASLLLPRL